MKRPLYIFDLDGTLALIDHRIGILQQEHATAQEKWAKFYDACDKDSPNAPVIETMELLRIAGAEIWILSGRGADVKEKTIEWLVKHTTFTRIELLHGALTMRLEGDHRPDHELKLQWLDRMLVEDRERLVSVFDDRASVVSMWRVAGVTCFQVADGNF